MPNWEALVNKHTPSDTRVVSLFRNGRNQAIRIPVEFELPGDEVTIRKVGDELVLSPVVPRARSFAEVRSRMQTFSADEFPDISDDDLLPLDDIAL